jgi:hypothetical protein
LETKLRGEGWTVTVPALEDVEGYVSFAARSDSTTAVIDQEARLGAQGRAVQAPVVELELSIDETC